MDNLRGEEIGSNSWILGNTSSVFGNIITKNKVVNIAQRYCKSVGEIFILEVERLVYH